MDKAWREKHSKGTLKALTLNNNVETLLFSSLAPNDFLNLLGYTIYDYTCPNGNLQKYPIYSNPSLAKSFAFFVIYSANITGLIDWAIKTRYQNTRRNSSRKTRLKAFSIDQGPHKPILSISCNAPSSIFDA